MRKTFTPFPGFILVRPVTEAPDTDSYGLKIPDSAKEPPMEATVVGAGQLAVKIAAGDVIAYSKHAGRDIWLNGEKLLLLRESEALGFYQDITEEVPIG